MNKITIIKNYFRGLEARSYEQVIQLFSKDAIVHSPLYGKINAVKFYKDLFSDTNNSKIMLKNILISETNPDIAAAHFLYNWTLKDGSEISFECVDVFEFSSTNEILDLKIIYDTHKIRTTFESIK